MKLFQLQVCQYFGDLRFSVTINSNTRIPRYGQVCRGTYHAKEIPRYTGVPVFFPNPTRHHNKLSYFIQYTQVEGQKGTIHCLTVTYLSHLCKVLKLMVFSHCPLLNLSTFNTFEMYVQSCTVLLQNLARIFSLFTENKYLAI